GPLGTPSIAKDGKLYAATARKMLCVDLEGQKILWEFPKDGHIAFYTERDIRKNEVWFRVGDGLILDGIEVQGKKRDLLLCCALEKVFAIDRHTGERLWEVQRPGAPIPDNPGVSALVSDGKWVFGCTNLLDSSPRKNPEIPNPVDQMIWALEAATGKPAQTREGKEWTVNLAGTTFCVGNCMGALENGILYWINGGDGVSGHRNLAATFFAVDVESAKVLWTTSNQFHCTGHCGPLALCDGILIASGTVEEKDRKNSYLTALDIKYQKKAWGYPLITDPPLKRLRELYNPVVVKSEGRVYFGTGRKGKLEFCCVNLKDGTPIWTFTEEAPPPNELKGWSRAQPIVAGGRVFFTTYGNEIYCLGERGK
ncbi:MAG: PQQ-binding-like beta-propeller repeat protein, partial [Planctomycetota bacterium]